jgi:predicted enzyme related to lactoylglutathione lyase
MILLKSLLTEAKKSSEDLILVKEGGKQLRFGSQKEMDKYIEDWIQKHIKKPNNVNWYGVTRSEAEEMFWYEHHTPREWVLDAEKIPDKYWVWATIPDIKDIQKFYETVEDWKQGSDSSNAKFLEKFKEYFDIGKRKNPEVFRPDFPKRTPVYRGLNNISPSIKRVIKNSDWRDWKRTEFKAGKRENDYWYTYGGKFTYEPHQPAQSWTTDPKVIFDGFYDSESSVILTKRLDDEFYFSNKFLDWISHGTFRGEKEVVRIATKGSDVELLVTRRTIVSLKGHEWSDSDSEKMAKRDKF